MLVPKTLLFLSDGYLWTRQVSENGKEDVIVTSLDVTSIGCRSKEQYSTSCCSNTHYEEVT